MPYYDFLCRHCQKSFERRVDYELRDLAVPCPVCPGVARRVWLTAPGIAFKGPGWSNVERAIKTNKEIETAANKDWAIENELTFRKNCTEALNTARDYTDQDHQDAEDAVKAFRDKGAAVGAY